MKRFLIKLTLVVVPTVLVAVVACVVTMIQDGKGEPTYQRGFVSQVRALEKADPKVPKVIFVGGSYLTFSMDEKTTREMLPMPSYCLGLHSGMGMCYVFETSKRFVKKDDLIVFPFAAFSKEDYGMPLIYLSLRGEPDLQRDFLVHHPFVVLSSVAPYCFHRWSATFEPILRGFKLEQQQASGYSHKWFNPTNGFYNLERVSHWDPSRLGLPVRCSIDDVDCTCFEILNEFDSFCKEHGARFVLAHSPSLDVAVKSQPAELEKFDQDLTTHLTAPIVMSRSDALFSSGFIYDFPRHLTSDGAVLYTRKLCELLKRFLFRGEALTALTQEICNTPNP